ncbi:MAG: hypothetical protein KJS45_11645 [Bacteroidetes bacterium]|nr:hypothetical protein [Bacteroidota bacterium]
MCNNQQLDINGNGKINGNLDISGNLKTNGKIDASGVASFKTTNFQINDLYVPLVTKSNIKIDYGTVEGGSASGTIDFGFTFTNNPTVLVSVSNNTTNELQRVAVNNIKTTSFDYAKSYLTNIDPTIQPNINDEWYWLAIGI